jgi:hypothetical protein
VLRRQAERVVTGGLDLIQQVDAAVLREPGELFSGDFGCHSQTVYVSVLWQADDLQRRTG